MRSGQTNNLGDEWKWKTKNVLRQGKGQGMKILFAVKKYNEDWQEELITENENCIKDASSWAIANGFDRLRVVDIIDGEKPNFINCIN